MGTKNSNFGRNCSFCHGVVIDCKVLGPNFKSSAARSRKFAAAPRIGQWR